MTHHLAHYQANADGVQAHRRRWECRWYLADPWFALVASPHNTLFVARSGSVGNFEFPNTCNGNGSLGRNAPQKLAPLLPVEHHKQIQKISRDVLDAGNKHTTYTDHTHPHTLYMNHPNEDKHILLPNQHDPRNSESVASWHQTLNSGLATGCFGEDCPQWWWSSFHTFPTVKQSNPFGCHLCLAAWIFSKQTHMHCNLAKTRGTSGNHWESPW